MKRNLEIIRSLLLQIETFPYPNKYMTLEAEDSTASEISYHVRLLTEGGLIEAEDNPYSCFDEWSQVRLTWQGHELLELARNQAHWEAAQKILVDRNAGLHFKLLADELLRHKSEDHSA